MNAISSSRSMFSFAMPSFWRGAARVLDMGATFDAQYDSINGEAADRLALAQDWTQVGFDLLDAMERYEDAQ